MNLSIEVYMVELRYPEIQDAEALNRIVKDEDDYAKKVLKQCEDIKFKLENDLIEKYYVKSTSLSEPQVEKNGDYLYYSRKNTEDTQQKLYRRKISSEIEELVFDYNTLSDSSEYFQTENQTISPDNKYLAFLLDRSGNENFSLYIVDIGTGKISEISDQVTYNLVWNNDNRIIYYTKRDSYGLTSKILCSYDLENKLEKIIYEVDDKAFYLILHKSYSEKYLIVTIISYITSEIKLIDLSEKSSKLDTMITRTKGNLYFVDHHSGNFFIATNENGSYNYKIMSVSDENINIKDRWTELLRHQNDATIIVSNEILKFFKNYIVCLERESCKKYIRVINLKDQESYRIDFKEDVYNIDFQNSDSKTNFCNIFYSSFINPGIAYSLNLETGELSVRYENSINSFNPDNYQSKIIFADSIDNVKIPITIFYKKDLLKVDGSNPFYGRCYSGYGSVIEPGFDKAIMPLIDRGFIYGIIDARGSSKLGQNWYHDGRHLNKKNGIYDLVSSLEYLIHKKYTSADKIVIGGRSAGGLLVGAAINFRPDLFRLAILGVPICDLINKSINKYENAVQSHYDETGNPEIEEEFAYMQSYCPYRNIKRQNYPNIYTYGSVNDIRTGVTDLIRWIKKMREYKTDNNFLLFRALNGSHSYYSQADRLTEFAFMVFILNEQQR